MSIASYSVVGRILAEVLAAPPPPELGPPERSEAPGRLLELRRSGCVYAPPFATPLHFWAHALRDLLEQRRRPDLFEAMAAQALCRAEPGERVHATLSELAGGLHGKSLLLRGVRIRSGYRMIDQDVMASWVAEGENEFVAFFWLCPQWLAEAAPFDPETEDTEEPLEA